MKKLRILPLEERIVLDAAAATAVAHDAVQSATHDAPPPPVNILIVSDAVPDAFDLAAAAKEGTAVVTYDPNNTSLTSLAEKITQAAEGRSIASIALATEGSSGAFGLTAGDIVNSSTLNQANLNMVAFWHSIANSMVPGGGIDILGSHVAEGAQGQQLLVQLASIVNDSGTHISVFGSADDTGHTLLGANWNMESSQIGHTEGRDASLLYFDPTSLMAWNHSLTDTSPVPDAGSLLIISTSIADPMTLANAAKEGVQVIVFDPATTSLDSLSDRVRDAANGGLFSSIAYASDAMMGGFQLDATHFTTEATLTDTVDTSVADFWRSIGGHLLPNGSLAILGCNVAEGISGLTFVDTLESILNDQGSNIKVYASTDITGSSLYEGDWTLERGGLDAAATFFDAGLLSQWQHILPIPYIITPIDLYTGEDGSAGSFSVVLTFQPLGTVTVSFGTSDATEGLAPAPITFNSSNWNIPQIVVVQGVNDSIDDGSQIYNITTSWTSTSPVDSGAGPSVTFTNTDNDSAGVIYNGLPINTTVTGLSVTEAGTTSTSYTMQLSSRPTANVTIDFNLSNITQFGINNYVDQAEISINGGAFGQSGSYTFTPTGLNAWDSPITITVRALDDVHADLGQTINIVTTVASSTDATYSALNPEDVRFTVNDDDTPGYIVTPTSSVMTTDESGGTATFTVVLTAAPVADLLFNIVYQHSYLTLGITQATTDVSSLTFNGSNWNIPQTVTVTGVRDFYDDPLRPYNINVVPAFDRNTNPAYFFSLSNNPSTSVYLVSVDGGVDIMGYTITPLSGYTATEGGGTATFGVTLHTKPFGEFYVVASSDNLHQGTVSTVLGNGILRFDGNTWNIPQVVTVTSVVDNIDDGDQVFNIHLTPYANGNYDRAYFQLATPTVAITSIDVNTAGINVTAGTLTTTEAGGTATFTMALNSKPTSYVVIPVSSSDTTEGIIDKSFFFFDSSNWNTPQTLTIRGMDDLDDDGDIAYSIQFGAAQSYDLNYNGLTLSDLSVSNTDNDASTTAVTGSLVITPSSGTLTTSEALTNSSFTIALSSAPTANVTVNIRSLDTTEAVTNVSTRTFTTVNWATPQQVIVSGINDFELDGNIPYTIQLFTSSTDPNYNVQYTTVAGINTDNETAANLSLIINSTTTPFFTTTENQGYAIQLRLGSQPTGDVLITFNSSDPTGTYLSSPILKTRANWSTNDLYYLTVPQDNLVDGNQSFTLTPVITTIDPNYSSLSITPYSGTNIDNTPAYVAITSRFPGGVGTSDGYLNGYAFLQHVGASLPSRPTSDVTLTLTIDHPELAAFMSTSGLTDTYVLTFTPSNWYQPQAVGIMGFPGDSLGPDGAGLYNVLTSSSSLDPHFNNNVVNGFNLSSITSYPGIDTTIQWGQVVVTPITPSYTTESGGTASFAVHLAIKPYDNVVLTFQGNPAEGLFNTPTQTGTSTPTLTFTPLNWDQDQVITIVGVDDTQQNSTASYDLKISNVTWGSEPAPYHWNFLPNLYIYGTVYNLDNDGDVGVIVNQIAGVIDELGTTTASFSVSLNVAPTADVTLTLSSDDSTEGSLSTNTLTFTPANWSTPQIVTLTGVDDSRVDGDIPFTVSINTITSADAAYNNVDPPTAVPFTNIDNDVAEISIPITSLSTSAPPVAKVVATSAIPYSAPPSSFVYTSYYEGRTSDASFINYTEPHMQGNALDPRIIVTSFDRLVLDEDGNVEFMLVLSHAPTSPVILNLQLNNPLLGTLSTETVIFTPENWNQPHVVTVSSAKLQQADDLKVQFAPAVSEDIQYNGFEPSDVRIELSPKNNQGSMNMPGEALFFGDSGVLLGEIDEDLGYGDNSDVAVIQGQFDRIIDEWHILAI